MSACGSILQKTTKLPNELTSQRDLQLKAPGLILASYLVIKSIILKSSIITKKNIVLLLQKYIFEIYITQETYF